MAEKKVEGKQYMIQAMGPGQPQPGSLATTYNFITRIVTAPNGEELETVHTVITKIFEELPNGYPLMGLVVIPYFPPPDAKGGKEPKRVVLAPAGVPIPPLPPGLQK